MASRTGDILIARGLATRDRLHEAQREGNARREPICSRLLAAGVPEGALASVLSEKHGVPGVDLSRTAIAVSVLDLVPRGVAQGDLILPLSLEGERLHLGMARPLDERILSEVRFATGREVSPYVAVRASLARAVQEAYDCRERGEPLWCGADAGPGGPFLAAVVPGGDLVEAELVDDLLPESADPLEVTEVPIEVEVPPPPARAGGRRLVLVVDDEPEIRKLVRRTLEAKGYAVESAADGADALAKAEALVPDLVLLDAMLPKVHGFEAARRLKAGPRTRGVPVVMMTAIYRGWRFAADAREAYGAEDYVEKPFRIDDLLRRVEAALDAGAARAPAAPARVSPELARGRELLSAGQAAEAIVALEQAVRGDPYSAEAHHLLGRALRARGEHFRAMTELERAVELRPGHLAALRSLAALYEETGFRRKAAETLERALPAAPDEAVRGAIRRDLLRLL
ncbi:response regulator [Anaeromyxobacter sp. Fw109-5]|uniref:response regulator n=1 Tax=Anaeromyxobacter sp. (strain Fw109-5) TaxID=404589 RepID=UPI0000ED7FF8|nr:response regulator [Anaeromyxobacter sp. Fw109-5]ABS25139.1 response regulator receiver protein [Anaeromyxobacter sp. Fw109-5]